VARQKIEQTARHAKRDDRKQRCGCQPKQSVIPEANLVEDANEHYGRDQLDRELRDVGDAQGYDLTFDEQ
jgi:hypothetical protein